MSYKDSNEVREIKRQAVALRTFLASRGVEMPHTLALETVSQLMGDKFWNVTRAKAQGERTHVVPVLRDAPKVAWSRKFPDYPVDAKDPIEWTLVDGDLEVSLEGDLSYRGQYVVAVRHPMLGYLQCQTPVWWEADLIMDEWKQRMLQMVLDGVRPLTDEKLPVSLELREKEAFEVMGLCCMRAGTNEADVQAYVETVLTDCHP